MKDSRLTIFSIMFGVLYLVAFYYDLALFRYYPEVGEFHWLRNDGLGVGNTVVRLDRHRGARQRGHRVRGAKKYGGASLAWLGMDHPDGRRWLGC